MQIASVSFQGNKKLKNQLSEADKALKNHVPYQSPMGVVAENKNAYIKNPLEKFIQEFVEIHLEGGSSQEVFEKALKQGKAPSLFQEIQEKNLFMSQNEEGFIRSVRLAIKKYVTGNEAGVTSKRAYDMAELIKSKITTAEYKNLLAFISKFKPR